MKSCDSITGPYSLFTAPPTILTHMNIHKQLTTFAAIDIINTAVNITLYTLLTWLTVPVGFTVNRHMVTHPTVWDNQHPRLKYGKISRHQHQPSVKFHMVPNRISRNKEKTPP